MAERQRINKRLVDSVKTAGVERLLWDSELLGFGIRVAPTGRLTYVLQYRLDGRQRRYKIGTHGSPWTPETARQEARRLLGSIAGGDDPQRAKFEQRAELTVAETCDLYLAEGLVTRKGSSISAARSDIEHHVKPLLGMSRVGSLTRADLEGLLRDVAAGKTARTFKQGPRRLARVTGGKGAANSSLTTLSAALGFAVTRGLRPDNPAIGIRKFPSKKIERFLSPAELARLGQVLASAAALGVESPFALAAIRLLMLTGCRKNEILTLKRVHVDHYHRCLRLALPTPSVTTIVRLLLWAVLLIVVWSTFRPRRPPWLNLAMPVADLKSLPGVSVASVTLSLIVFNALFALQNALDIAFLWSGAGLPDGVTMAEYVHRGAYPLIATALLAGLFVLVALRPGSATADAPLIRRLVTLWVAQNIFLVASSMLRTFDYIDAYSLTRLRIAALAWMGLVAVGLALILWRMLRAKSAGWLINANAVTAGIVLSACTIVDLGSVAATWNVRHAREVGGRGAALDLCYLERLGPSAFVALVELEQRRLAPAFRQRVANSRAWVRIWLRHHHEDGGWTWRDARRLNRAVQLGGSRSVNDLSTKMLNCEGQPIPQPEIAPPPPTPAPPPPPLTKAPQR